MDTEPDIAILINLLRESLPYLVQLEMSTKTSVVLRSLIADIRIVTDIED
jgi:hypothetical protein